MAAPIADLADVAFAIPPISRRLNAEFRRGGASEHEMEAAFDDNQIAVFAALSVRFTQECRAQTLVTLNDGSMPVMDPIRYEVWGSMVDHLNCYADRAARERRPEVSQFAINLRDNTYREVRPSNRYPSGAARRASKYSDARQRFIEKF